MMTSDTEQVAPGDEASPDLLPRAAGAQVPPTATAAEPAHPGRLRRWLSAIALPGAAVVAVGGLVVGLVFAVILGIRWWDDAFVKEPAQVAREEALGGAEQAMLNVLNLDLKDTAGWRKRSEGSLTGTARTQLLGDGGLGAIQQQAGNLDQAAVLSAKLVRSAVVEVNPDNKTAKAMVFLAVTQTRPGQASASQTMGFQVDVLKDGDVWKANAVQPLDAIALDDNTAGVPGATPSATGPATPAPAAGATPTPGPAPVGGN